MAEINQTLTQLKLEPANTKNLKSFVGELNGNLKILEKGFGVKIFHFEIPRWSQNGPRLANSLKMVPKLTKLYPKINDSGTAFL